MGAALTYARRYALFTLVGIAGEDDLDAPDLPVVGLSPEAQEDPQSAQQMRRGLERPTTEIASERPLQPSDRRTRVKRPRPPNLSPGASEGLRQRLISELEQLADSEALASWAYRALPLKNQLSANDAEAVEAGFAAKLTQLGEAAPVSPPQNQQSNGYRRQPQRRESGATEVTIIGKPVAERDRDHLRFVAAQPCLVCGRTPSDSHHIKFAEQRAMGRKVSDRFSVPICRLHHRELHRGGNERAWWEKHAIDPLSVAANLWAKTHQIASDASNIVGETAAEINGRHFADGAGTGWPQNYETKPIVPPEAE